MLPHAGALVCPPPHHRLSGHFPRTLSLIFNTIPTILTAFPPRFAALPKPCSDPRRRSNPIAHRVRRKRQRLPPSLLIENASDRDPAPPQKSAPRRFRSRLATIQDLSRIAGRIKTPTVGLLRIARLSAKWIISAIESRKNHLTFTRFREACTILPSVVPHGSSGRQNPCWRT